MRRVRAVAAEVLQDTTGEGLVAVSLAVLAGRSQVEPLRVPLQNPPLLPLEHLEPEVFERLVAEMAARQDNLGVQFYGRRGQKQYGLDIVERRPDRQRWLYQVKRHQELTPSLIRQAVRAYAGPPRRGNSRLAPRLFAPSRFVVVTSAQLERDTANVDTVDALQDEYADDLEIEVWGAEAVGRKLRDAQNLVFAVFGEAWAKAWCGFAPPSVSQAAPLSLGLVDTPIAVVGHSALGVSLQALHDDAEQALSTGDPAQAARLYGVLAQALDDAHFPGHAARMRAQQAAAATAAGDAAGSFTLRFQLVLDEVLRGDTTERGLSRQMTDAAAAAGAVPQAKCTVLRHLLGWYEQGSELAETVPALQEICAAGDEDAALLCCLVLEQAVVDGLFDFDPPHSVVVEGDDDLPRLLGELRQVAGDVSSADVIVRARLACALADASLTAACSPQQVQKTYGGLLQDAGAGRYRHARGLVAARGAHAFAVRGDLDRAEALLQQ
jgi:hypothetical protein